MMTITNMVVLATTKYGADSAEVFLLLLLLFYSQHVSVGRSSAILIISREETCVVRVRVRT